MAEATVGLLRAVLTSHNAQFDTAFERSTGKVDAFDTTTKAAKRSIDRLVGDFRGDKVVAEATKMAAAIEKVGGVSKLTDAELGRVNRTLDAAAAKYRALGQDVPPQIANLRAEIAALDRTSGAASSGGGGLTKMQGVVGTLGKLLPALTVAGAVTGVLALGGAALESADKFVTFSERAGVSIETAQRWDYVAKQTSTSLETFAAATTKLGINISTGTEKARGAISELGLSYAQLRQMAPEEQFNTVVAALEDVDSVTERNRLGTALFGNQFTEIAVAIQEGYTDIAKQATVAGDDQVRAAEAAGDALEKLKGKIAAGSLNIFGRLAQELTDTPIDLDRLTQEQLDYYHTLLRGGGDAYGYLLQLERDRVKGMHDIELETEAAGTATTDYVAKLAAAKAEVASLNTGQKAQIDAALKMGSVTDELADAVGVSTTALELYKQQKEDDAKASAKAKEDAEKFAAAVRQVPIAFRGWLTIPETVRDTRDAIAEVRQSMDAMSGVTFNQNFVPLKGAAPSAGKELSAVATGLRDNAQFKAQFKDTLKGVPQTMAAAMTGGGGLKGGLGAVGSQMGGLLGEKLGGAVAKKLAGAAIGKALGGVVGSIAGPLGSIAGAYIGNKLGSMFSGPSKEVKEMRSTVAGFQADLAKTLTASQRQEAGGEQWKMSVIAVRDAYLATGRSAADAEKIVKQMWDTGHPEKAKAAIEEINAVLEEQKAIMQANLQTANDLFGQIMDLGQNGIPQSFGPAIDKLVGLGLLTDEQVAKLREAQKQIGPSTKQMEAALAVVGGRMESLGPAFQQAKINETAMQYVNAIKTMIEGGGDLGGILFDSKEELGALVEEALKSGKTLPANLQPWIDDLVRSGNLIDKNGEKITDVSGLKYGEKLKTEGEKSLEMWDKILGKIDELVAKITKSITPAIDDATRDRDMTVTTRFRRQDGEDQTERSDDDPRGHRVGTLGRYGTWFKNFGRGTATTLHGSEAVVTRSQAVPFAMDTLQTALPSIAEASGGAMSAAASGPAMAKVQLVMDGRRVAEALVPVLPGAIRRYGVQV